MSLQRYIQQRNRITKAFSPRERLLDIDELTREDMRRLAQYLATDLAPEALTCDGELRGASLAAKRALLNQAVTELRQLGQEVIQL